MNKLYLVFLALVTFNSQVIYCQHQQIIPPSPEAASLGEYGNSRVNKYVGKPDIQIPLYTIDGIKIKFPITMSYDASGFRPNQLATWVGLGWSINTGGVISRTLNGYPDEGAGNIIGYFQGYDDIVKYSNGAPDLCNQEGFFSSLREYNNYEKGLQNHQEGGYQDTQPDLYSLSYPGFSGTFHLSPNSNTLQAYLSDHKAIDIDPNHDESFQTSRFIVKDEYGNTYIFKDIEKTHIISDDPVAYHYNSSWYLSEISSVNDEDHYYFNYDSVNTTEVVDNYKSVSQTTIVQGSANCSINATNNVSSSTPYYITKKYLSSIEYHRFGTKMLQVDFNSDDDRLDDLISGKKLNSIDILNSKNQIVKTYDFRYDYFGNISNENTCRLKLEEIEESGSLDGISYASLPPYQFSYIEETAQVPNRRTSSAIDHWGFFNSNSGGLIPRTEYPNGLDVIIDGGDRSPNYNRTSLFNLNQIIYPLGGKTRFSYELNDVPTDPFISSKYKKNDNYSGLEGGYLPDGQINSYYNDDRAAGEPKYLIKEITISSLDQYVRIVDGECGGAQCVEPEDVAEVKVFSGHNLPPFAFSNTPQYYRSLRGLIAQGVDGGYEEPLLNPLPLGDYTVLIFNTIEEATIGFGNQEIVRKQSIIGGEPHKIGGLRIKKISNYDENNTVVSQKTYEYEGGKLFSWPNYHKTISDVTGSGCFGVVSYASSISPLNTIQGSHLGYSRVTERQTSNVNGASSNGKIVYSFINDDLEWETGTPMPVFTKNGDIHNREVFNDQGGKVAETIYEYEYATDANATPRPGVSGFSLNTVYYNYLRNLCYYTDPDTGCELAYERFCVDNLDCPCQHGGSLVEANTIYETTGVYSYRSKLKFMKSKIEREYYGTNLEDIIEYREEYIHDNYDHNFTTQVIKTTSTNNKKLITDFVYPDDYVGSDQSVNELINNHIKKYVLEEINYVDIDNLKYVTSYIKSIYSNNLLSNLRTVNINTPTPINQISMLNERSDLIFEYSANGKLLSVITSEGIKKSYTWSDFFPMNEAISDQATGFLLFSNFENADNLTINSFSNDAFLGDQSGMGSIFYDFGPNSNKDYILDFVIKGNSNVSIDLNGNPLATISATQEWKAHSLQLSNATSFSVSLGSSKIDNLRIYQKGTMMTSYDIDEVYGIKSIVDPNMIKSEFVYDEFGRLHKSDRNNEILQVFEYYVYDPTLSGGG